MNKKLVIGVIVIIIILLGIGGVYLFSMKDDTKMSEGVIKTNDGTDDNITNSKVLVVYYSAQSHTESVAKKIADNLDADLFEIVPKDVYTSDDLDYNDSDSRVSKEYNDEALRDVELESTSVEDWDNYDVVLIGYPIWWGIAAWPVNTFVKNNDFTRKTIIPFCTSGSSGLGNSATLLEDLTKTGEWAQGHRFSSNPSDSDIKEWTDSLVA